MSHEYGRPVKYPYTLPGKLMYFPWKYYFKHGRGFRYVVYGLIGSYPLFYQLHKFVNSPANVEMWKEVRAKRHHDVFARPHE